MNLRKEAEGRECQVRIPGVCNNDRNTVILAHVNEKSVVGAGMGMKVDDAFGAICCHACHDAIDGRMNPVLDNMGYAFTHDELLIFQYQGTFRTQKMFMDEGKLWNSQE